MIFINGYINFESIIRNFDRMQKVKLCSKTILVFSNPSIIQQIGLQNNNNGVCMKNIPWQVTRLLGIIQNDYLYQKQLLSFTFLRKVNSNKILKVEQIQKLKLLRLIFILIKYLYDLSKDIKLLFLR